MDREFLTSKEVEEIFKIKRQTLNAWRRNGIIDFVKITDRKILYPQQSVDTLLQKK